MFENRLQLTLKSTTSLERLEETFVDIFKKFTLPKCKYLRANCSKFMTTELSKAIMLRTRFRHRFFKMKTSEAKAKNKWQRKICVGLTGKAKRNCYERFDLNNIPDNKKIVIHVKPLFSNKIKSAKNIALSENGKLMKDEKEVANFFNNFFS